MFIETVRRLRSSSGDVGSLGPPPGALSTPEFDLDGDDLAKAYLSGAPSLVPSRGAVTYTLLTALPVWGMCPIWNPSWQSWVAFPVGFGFQLQLLFGSKLWKRRSLRRAGNQALAKSNRSHFTGVALGVDRFGITEVTRNTRTQARWSAVKQYEVSMDVAAFHDGTGMIILPRHAFETDDAYLDFVEKALEYRRQALAA